MTVCWQSEIENWWVENEQCVRSTATRVAARYRGALCGALDTDDIVSNAVLHVVNAVRNGADTRRFGRRAIVGIVTNAMREMAIKAGTWNYNIYDERRSAAKVVYEWQFRASALDGDMDVNPFDLLATTAATETVAIEQECSERISRLLSMLSPKERHVALEMMRSELGVSDRAIARRASARSGMKIGVGDVADARNTMAEMIAPLIAAGVWE